MGNIFGCKILNRKLFSISRYKFTLSYILTFLHLKIIYQSISEISNHDISRSYIFHILFFLLKLEWKSVWLFPATCLLPHYIWLGSSVWTLCSVPTFHSLTLSWPLYSLLFNWFFRILTVVVILLIAYIFQIWWFSSPWACVSIILIL